ncbi:hypothetical protein FQZ97_1053350 [compost metagenome]
MFERARQRQEQGRGDRVAGVGVEPGDVPMHLAGHHTQQHSAKGRHHGQTRQGHQQLVKKKDESGHRTLLVRQHNHKGKDAVGEEARMPGAPHRAGKISGNLAAGAAPATHEAMPPQDTEEPA